MIMSTMSEFPQRLLLNQLTCWNVARLGYYRRWVSFPSWRCHRNTTLPSGRSSGELYW